VIPTPRKRILTSEWLPPPNMRLLDFSKENGMEKNETAIQKNLDAGRENKRGESRKKGTKKGNKNGSKKVEENGQQKNGQKLVENFFDAFNLYSVV